jgi:ElaB/YqjD/DUF883 family membrane-anchored ribosome-binding protein
MIAIRKLAGLEAIRSRVEDAVANPVQARKDAEGVIKANPIATIAAALTLGVLIGWLIKRR